MTSSQNEATTKTVFESTVIPCSVDEPKSVLFSGDCFTGISLGESFEVSMSYQPLKRAYPPNSLVYLTNPPTSVQDRNTDVSTDKQHSRPLVSSTANNTQHVYQGLSNGCVGSGSGRSALYNVTDVKEKTPRETLESLVRLEMEVAELEHQFSAVGCGLHHNSVPATLIEIERILENFQSDHHQRVKRALDITETKVGVLTTLCKRMVGTTIVDPNQAADCCRELSAIRPLAPFIKMAMNNLQAIDAMEKEWESVRDGVADTVMKVCNFDDGVENNAAKGEDFDEVDGRIPIYHKLQVHVDKRNLDALEHVVQEMEEMLMSTQTTLLEDFDSFEEKLLNKRRTLLMSCHSK